jgi:hypothetical protein
VGGAPPITRHTRPGRWRESRHQVQRDHAGEEEKYTLVLANPPFELEVCCGFQLCAACSDLPAFRNSDVHADTTRQD